MYISKRVINTTLLCYLFLNFSIRYPSTDHINGSTDSLVYAAITNFLIIDGNFGWFVNPLSLFALYPNSESSGGLILVGSISCLTGIDVEYSVLINNYFFGLLSLLGFFAFIKEYTGKREIALIGSIVFSTSNNIVGGTSWIFNIRTFFVILIPITLFYFSLCFNHISKRYSTKKINYKNILLLIIWFLVTVSFHNLFLLFGIILLSCSIYLLIENFLSPFLVISYYRRISFFMFFCLVIITILYVNYLGYTIYSPSLEILKSDYFFEGDNFLLFLLNFGIMYSMSTSILILFAPLVFLQYITKRKTEVKSTNLFLFTLLLIIPFIYDSSYMLNIGSFLVCIFISLGIYISSNHLIYSNYSSKNYVVMAVFILLLLSSILPLFIVVKPEPSGRSENISVDIDHETYNIGLYTKIYLDNGTYVINDGKLEEKITFISAKPALSENLGVDEYLYDYQDTDNLGVIMLSELTISDAFDERFRLFVDVNKRSSNDYNYLKHHIYDDPISREICKKYNIHFVMVNNDLDNDMYYLLSNFSRVGPVLSPFYSSVSEDFYKIYEDKLHRTSYLNW